MSASTSAILEAVATAKLNARLYACNYFVCMKDQKVLILTELSRVRTHVDEVIFSTKTGYKAA